MNEGERVKVIRKKINYTLEKFAEPLGVTKVAISNIENGNRALTEQMLKAICREYNVNEAWLRTGEGEMFNTLTRSENLAKFAGELMKDEEDSFRRRLVELLSELNEDEWILLEKLAKKLAKKID